ncbi:MAG: DUF4031 domain-containing protein [Propionicimonas sp.]|uniref:DUF4031 domain-containing protein n=1 Tax=Propionicimonas sp. TaxID=1955623 RepID=UPI003D0A30C2
MALLIDAPRWPAHGTLFCHLVSDTSLDELFDFADRLALPMRAFDHDHYDVPQERHDELVAAGALAVPSPELVRRLVASGLRVRRRQRTPKRAEVLPGLVAAWDRLLPGRSELGADLLRRWQEPLRHYHDVRHLWQVLGALRQLSGGGPARPVALAAWFHDAVYEGVAGADEEASALLAEEVLPAAGVAHDEVDEVARLVRLTAGHSPSPDDVAGIQLVDADLSILGQLPGRYHVYARDVRLEYPQYSDQDFANGRLRVLDTLLARPSLYASAAAREAWAGQAARNLVSERRRWLRFATSKWVQ